jgi:hypothetical protein
MTNLLAAICTNMMVFGMYTNSSVYYATNSTVWSGPASEIEFAALDAGGTLKAIKEARSVVTNVTHGSNESGCKICSGSPGMIPAVFHYGGQYAPCAPYKPATERTETTEVVETKTLTFSWDGKEYAVKRERVLSRKVKRWTLKENWVEDKP